MTTSFLPPLPVFRAFDSTGKPLNGGLLYTYTAGTTTPHATYTDQSGATANANPVVLDSTGTANVWLDGTLYKFVLKDSNNVTQWTVDNIAGVVNISPAMQPVVQASTVAAALALLGGINAATLAAAIAAASLPTGVGPLPHSGSTAPVGWLAAEGQLVSRTTYAALWTFAQSSGNIAANDGAWVAHSGQYSPGNGSTTFRMPDMRGNVPRGWDDGAGVDPSRALGSYQADAIASHAVPVTITDPGHVHVTNVETSGFVASGSGATMALTNPGSTTDAAFTNVTAVGAYAGATETKVKNNAFLFIIKT